MSSGCKAYRKVARKLKHCEEILFKYENIKTTCNPTKVIFIGNGGLGCSIQRELLANIFGYYGPLENIIMLPGKPYSFVKFCYKEDAERAMNCINGHSLTSGHLFYMAYINDADVPEEVPFCSSLPKGLVLLEDFVTEDEEKELLAAIEFDDSSSLKHRKVKHYGYEFLYGNNNVDKNKCLEEKIPSVCLPHLEKLVAHDYISNMPNQLTVNYYLPGQGIPPHVDTHSAFEDGIISLSLGSQVVMDFYGPSKEIVPVLLPRRSILIMSGESRYLWKHGITPRKTDIIPVRTESGPCLTLYHRSPRMSFTFRRIRTGECACEYKEQCDSQQKLRSSPSDLVDETAAKGLENKYVYQVYEEIADHFNITRYKPWPKVASFLSSVPFGSIILDVGCGNGKNMGLSSHCFEIGCDASSKLAQICSDRKAQVLVADCLKLPFRDNFADVVICIAVIHHLSTKVRRAKALEEIVRVLCPKGRALIYVWAFEQDGPEGQSNYLKCKNSCENSYQEKGENVPSAEIQINDCNNSPKLIKMPVHKNRTNFVEQDMLVPWKEKKSSCQSPKEVSVDVHHRYYHVFAEGELESLVIKSNAHILSSYYDKGNWCVLLEK